MKDLPYLRTDSHGKPAGPHVVLLSGSSWAEGSYEYHVNRPVNYILEADSDKRAFLEKTRFFESGFPERVSGAADDQRMAQLRFATQKTVELIIREYERKAGKILLVVNSYAQAQEVQQTLEAALRKANCSIHVKMSKIDQPQQQFAEKDMIELYPLQLQSGDNATNWIFYTNALRHIPIQYSQSTVLPLPLHLAKSLEEYLFDA